MSLTALALPFILALAGVLFIRFRRMSFKESLGYYFIFSILSILSVYFLLPETPFYYPIVISVVGVLTFLLIAGVYGSKLSLDTYQAILFGVGLFPFYFGVMPIIVYIFGSLFWIGVDTTIQRRRAFKKIGEKYVSSKKAKRNLTKEKYKEYLSLSRIRIPTAIALANITSLSYFLLSSF